MTRHFSIGFQLKRCGPSQDQGLAENGDTALSPRNGDVSASKRESYLAEFVRKAQQHQDRLSQRTIHAISPDPEELPVKQTEDDHGQLGSRPIGHRDILMHELDLDPPYAAQPGPGPDRPARPTPVSLWDDLYGVRGVRDAIGHDTQSRSASAPLVPSTQGWGTSPWRRSTPSDGGVTPLRPRPAPSAAVGRPPSATVEPATTLHTSSPPVTAVGPPAKSILAQFQHSNRAPMDEAGPGLSENVSSLMESIWQNPISKEETSKLYTSLPRPANLACLHKTRINPEIAHKLPKDVTDRDSILGSIQLGLQFVARPLAHLLEGLDRGEVPDIQTLAEVTVTSLRLLARCSGQLNNARRDNVRGCLQPSIQPLAKNSGSQGFVYLLGENLREKLAAINDLNKTALETLTRGRGRQRRGRGARPGHPYAPPPPQGNGRGGSSWGRLVRHRPLDSNRRAPTPRGRGARRGQGNSRHRHQ